MKKGEIAERGTHEELLSKGNGVYRQLVERQLTGQTMIYQDEDNPKETKTAVK